MRGVRRRGRGIRVRERARPTTSHRRMLRRLRRTRAIGDNAGSPHRPQRPRSMLNKAAADLLEGFADALEIRGANTFRVRAFRNAARRVDSLTTDVAELVESGEISKVRGIGKGIAGVLGEFVAKGRVDEYEEMRAEIPDSVFRNAADSGSGSEDGRHAVQQARDRQRGRAGGCRARGRAGRYPDDWGQAPGSAVAGAGSVPGADCAAAAGRRAADCRAADCARGGRAGGSDRAVRRAACGGVGRRSATWTSWRPRRVRGR